MAWNPVYDPDDPRWAWEPPDRPEDRMGCLRFLLSVSVGALVVLAAMALLVVLLFI